MNTVDALAESLSTHWLLAHIGHMSWASICRECITLRNYTLRAFGQGSDEYQAVRVLNWVARQRHMDQVSG